MTHIARRRLRAMGTDVHLILLGGPDPGRILSDLLSRVEDLEARWSRFLEGSEISALRQLGDSGGGTMAVSEDVVLLIECGVEAWRMTGGRFDATVDVAALGYDRPYLDLVRCGRIAVPVSPIGPPRHHRCQGSGALVVDRVAGTVTVPSGVCFDPGGIGKGLAADLLVDQAMESGCAGACVNLGGDLRVEGEAPDSEGWVIEVSDPFAPPPDPADDKGIPKGMATIDLLQGAVATSTPLRRRWLQDGEARHHLVDPATGRPGTSDLAAVTVVAGEAWLAEALATATWLAGIASLDDLPEHQACGLAVTKDGGLVVGAGMGRFLL